MCNFFLIYLSASLFFFPHRQIYTVSETELLVEEFLPFFPGSDWMRNHVQGSAHNKEPNPNYLTSSKQADLCSLQDALQGGHEYGLLLDHDQYQDKMKSGEVMRDEKENISFVNDKDKSNISQYPDSK